MPLSSYKRKNGRGFVSSLTGQPWYVQAIALVGAPTLAAAFLIYWITTSLSTRLGSIELLLQTQATQAVIVAQHVQSDSMQNWALIGVVQRICINTAKTDDARLSCTITTNPGGVK